MIRYDQIGLLLLCILSTPVKADENATARLSTDEQAVVNLTNAERKKQGLSDLKPQSKLMQIARQHAANMAKQNKLDHELDGKNVMDRLKETGYVLSRVGENIAWNQKNPTMAVTGWMNSEGHRQNILTPEFQDIGVAVARNGKGERFWVQVFARPR